jgi:hypothetical protein
VRDFWAKRLLQSALQKAFGWQFSFEWLLGGIAQVWMKDISILSRGWESLVSERHK